METESKFHTWVTQTKVHNSHRHVCAQKTGSTTCISALGDEETKLF